MNNEIWKPILGYEGLYDISNMGNIRSYHHGTCTEITTNKNAAGYCRAYLYKDGKRVKFLVHRLVAIHFVNNQNPELNTVVNHLDEIKTNNRADNLEWTTPLGNMIYSHIQEKSIKKVSRGVVQLTLSGQVLCYWASPNVVKTELGFPKVGRACKTQRPYKGFLWKYVDGRDDYSTTHICPICGKKYKNADNPTKTCSTKCGRKMQDITMHRGVAPPKRKYLSSN
jgi:uncharacterized HNH endonuclease L247